MLDEMNRHIYNVSEMVLETAGSEEEDYEIEVVIETVYRNGIYKTFHLDDFGNEKWEIDSPTLVEARGVHNTLVAMYIPVIKHHREK